MRFGQGEEEEVGKVVHGLVLDLLGCVGDERFWKGIHGDGGD